MPRGAIGLDIGSHSVHVAQVATTRGAPTIVNFGGLELPDGAVREGEVVDPATVADAVKELVGSAGIRDKRVHLGVANQRVVVRQVDLPYLPPDELRSSIRFQVQEHIPIPVEEAELDFQVVDEFTTPVEGEPEGARMVRILLVAAAKNMVAEHVEAVTKAGLKPMGVDLNPFAVVRAMGREEGIDDVDQVLVDVGAGVTNVVVHRHGTPTFVRNLLMGGNDITEAVVTGMGLDRHDAERRKRDTVISASQEPDDVADRIIGDHAAQFVDEVRSSLDYYQSQAPSVRLSEVVLTGGGALLAGLPEQLAARLRLPVEVGNPFDRFAVKGTVYSPDQLAMVGPTLATSVGLALGGAA